MSEGNRYSFVVEYFDSYANMSRSYQFLYYLGDKTIEMFDLKTRRMFLKRCAYPSLQLKELFVGATINVFSRSLKIVEYGDEVTRKTLAAGVGQVMLVVSEQALLNAGHVVKSLTDKELRISNIRMVDIPQDIASRNNISARCILLIVNGSGISERAVQVCSEFPKYVSMIEDANDAVTLEDTVFGPSRTTAMMQNCAVCVIKPHAITSGHHGPILQRLLDEGFQVTALGQYTMSPADAEDFLEVYNGVVPEYKKLVEQMSSGPCWAVEVCSGNAVMALRAVCGPHDPETCHVLFPQTIRSTYGVDRCRNAVHCTDLEEDGPLESEFFFSLMQNKQ